MLVSKRHKKHALRTKVVKRITQIPPDDWNAVFPKVLESYDFFRTLDESNLEQFSLFYIMVYDRKTPVGAAPCFFVNYSLDTSINGPLRRVTNSITKHIPNIFSVKAVACGMPIGPGRIGVIGEADPVIKAILRRLEQIAKKNRVPIIAFKDFYKTDLKILDPLQKNGFSRFESLPTTELAVRFRNFEEYLKALSRKSRYDLRRKFKKVDGRVKIDQEVVTQPDEKTYREIYQLYRDVVDKHEMGFEVLPVSFFKNLSKNMPDNVKYFLWRIDGKLAAFSLSLVSEDLFMAYYIGLDYSVTYTYHLYFVKFRDMLNWCIKQNIKVYNMGNAGYEPKRQLGFRPVPLYLYVKLRNRLLRPFFNLICQFLKFENFDPALKKMKQKAAKI